MKKINVVKNSEGYNCIRMMKDVSVLELKELCNSITNGLIEQNYNVRFTDIIINDSFVIIQIDMFTEDSDIIGTVEFMCDNDNSEYYDLLQNRTAVQSNVWTQEAWEEYSIKVFEDIFKMLSK